MVERASRPLRHLACIMDGNRRWANQNAVPSLLYQEPAVRAIFAVIERCLAHRIPFLSLYAFSLENYTNRNAEVREIVFDGVLRVCKEKQAFFKEKGVRVRFCGMRDLYPAAVRAAVEELEVATIEGSALTLSILLCYGAQQEIAAAATALVASAPTDTSSGMITPERFMQYAWTAYMPSVDLIIRTGGAHRLSNFLLFQAAYAELLFLDILWPEVTGEVIDQALVWFGGQLRNFGA